VLLAYAKLDLDAQVLASTLPGDPAFAALLAGYFPPEAVRTFPEEPQRHRLKREIISTVLVNAIVNLAGPLFVLRTAEVTGLVRRRHRARFCAERRRIWPFSALKSRIDALDGKVDANVQTQLYGAIADQFRRATRWFLTHVPHRTRRIADASALYHAGRGGAAPQPCPHRWRRRQDRRADRPRRARRYRAHDVTLLPHADLGARRGAAGAGCGSGAGQGRRDLFRGWRHVGARSLAYALAAKFSPPDHWDRLALRRLLDDLYAAQRRIAHKLLSGGSSAESWAKIHGEALTRMRGFLTDLDASGELSVAKLMLASSQIQNLV
jgi:glutamate dehydrogenase